MKLPRPDSYGNYWIDATKFGPAIFPSGTRAAPVYPGKFFASTGRNGQGVLTSGDSLRYFDSPEEALKALERAGVK